MKKTFKIAALALLAGITLASCSDNEDPKKYVVPVQKEMIVLNQGNYYGGVEGTLDRLELGNTANNFWEGTLTSSVFKAANGQSLGDSPQNGVMCGSKLYVSVYASNLVWVLNPSTKKIIASVSTTEPEWVTTDGKNVYVANNNGFVTRIDTATYAKDSIKVGPNPACLVVANKHLYASISDGYNSTNGYANGKKVAKIDLQTFKKTKDIPVGLNPGRMDVDNAGNVFVVCMGNYGKITPEVQRISTSDKVDKVAAGNHIVCLRNLLYVFDSQTNWETGEVKTKVKIFNGSTLKEDSNNHFEEREMAPAPTGLFTDLNEKYVIVTSDPDGKGFNKPGFVYIYSSEGSFLKKLNVGIHPYSVIFPISYVTMVI